MVANGKKTNGFPGQHTIILWIISENYVVWHVLLDRSSFLKHCESESALR